MAIPDFSIINQAWSVLADDAIFLSYFDLTEISPPILKATKIQKEIDPVGLSADNIPMVCVYSIPGMRPRGNNLIYDAMFEIGIYSNTSTGIKSSTQKAGTLLIGQRVIELLHQVELGATFKTELQTSFQSSSSAIGIKRYTVRFKVSEVMR